MSTESYSKLRSRKFWIIAGFIGFFSVVVTLFTFVVGENAGPVWVGRMSVEHFVDLVKWLGGFAGAYVLGNFATNAIFAIKGKK